MDDLQQQQQVPQTVETNRTVSPTATESSETACSATVSPSSSSANCKKRKFNEEDKRRERNAREKARSNKLASQFDDLKEILIQAGVSVPRCTKGSILDSAMAYIRTLQVQAHQTELDRQRLQQQLDHGVHSTNTNPVHQGMSTLLEAPSSNGGIIPRPSIGWNQSYYKDAFEHCAVGMAIANVEGTLVNGNRVFCKLMGKEPHQVPTLTIFNLVAKDQLTLAFERLGAWLEGTDPSPSFGLRASIPGMALHVSRIANADPNRLEVDCQRNRLLITLVVVQPAAAVPTTAESSVVVTAAATVPETTTSAVTTTAATSSSDPCKPLETLSASDTTETTTRHPWSAPEGAS